jgi:hypothetical protein
LRKNSAQPQGGPPSCRIDLPENPAQKGHGYSSTSITEVLDTVTVFACPGNEPGGVTDALAVTDINSREWLVPPVQAAFAKVWVEY